MTDRAEYLENFVDVFMIAAKYSPTQNLLVSLGNFDAMLMEVGWESRPLLMKDCRVMVRRADMQKLYDRLQAYLLTRGAGPIAH